MLAQLFIHPKLKILSGPTYNPRVEYLEKLLSSMWGAWELGELQMMIARRELWAYESPTGVVLLDVVKWKRGNELRIIGIAGTDVLSHGVEIVDDLKMLAAYFNCSMIGGEGVPKGWLRAAPALGFKPISTHFLMELNDGQA